MLGLAASAPPALAEDGVAGVPALAVAVPDATELAGAILDDVAAAALPVPAVPAVPTVPAPEVVPTELPAAPAQPAAAEPVQTGTAAAPSPEPVSEPSPVAAPVVPQPLPEPEPAVVQQSPANVNVSVRVDSPGDDGAVTQLNVAVGGSSPQYQEPQTQYQPPVLPDPEEHEVDDVAPAAGEAAIDDWNWSWNWSCGDAPVGDIAIPVGVLQQNWNWNWNWICGGNEPAGNESIEESSDGYQAPTTQYRPVNINISIRINSPGDNGPVVQANVAVGVTLPAPVVIVPSMPPATPQTPAPAPVGSPTAVEAISGAALAVLGIATVSLAGDVVEDPEDCCLLRQPRAAVGFAEAPVSIVLSESTPVARRDTTADTGDTAAVAAVVARFELRARRVATAESAPPRPQARPAPPASTRAPSDDRDEAAVVTGGLGFAPLPGSDRLLPWIVLLGFSFLFAFASSSLVSAGSRPTPGADADEPPTRPG